MGYQLTPPPGHEDENVPRLRTGSNIAFAECAVADSHLRSSLGVRPGESNPGRMLSAVLLLVVAIIVLGLGLAWWLV
ncbi:MAG: hypothetical protein ACREX8_04670 [Gammaproteobacteria bacterium]